MTNSNFVRISGRLTRDVESRTSARGLAIASFTVAINEWYGGKQPVIYADCAAFGRLAEAIAQRRKGEVVAVIGRLHFNRWNDKQTGAKRSKLSVVADRVLCEHAADAPDIQIADGQADL